LLVDPLADALLGAPDVLHAIGVRLPQRPREPGGPAGRAPGRAQARAQVVTLHDINVFEFPELSTPAWREKRGARIRQALLRADSAIAYAERGAPAPARPRQIPRGRGRVVPCGVDTAVFRRPGERERGEVLARLDLLAPGGAARPCVLSIGEFSVRKNQA